MALKKIRYELLQIAERCDRRGKHEVAEKIRETIDDLLWSGFNPKISLAFEMALESKHNKTFEAILPQIATLSGYSVEELKNYPQIREYFDYAKRIAERHAAREREMARRLYEMNT